MSFSIVAVLKYHAGTTLQESHILLLCSVLLGVIASSQTWMHADTLCFCSDVVDVSVRLGIDATLLGQLCPISQKLGAPVTQ